MILAAPPPPARVQVQAVEFAFTLSRRSIKAGEAIIELVNRGQDAHDLRMERVGGTHVYVWPVVQPGGHVDRDLTLRPGTYLLWCSLANHRALGMSSRLVVVRR